MSINYFTGTNNSTSKNQTSDTAMTALGLCETEPVAGVDGLVPKPNVADAATAATNLTIYQRIRQKVYSKTSDGHGKSFANNVGCQNITKTRADRLSGKYELGKMWKYRKTLKKLFTATGNAAASSGNLGMRNMYTLKGKGCASAKNTKPAGTDNPLYPMDDSK
jgi:hypothetical protein